MHSLLQFTSDLFGGLDEVEPMPVVASAPQKNFKPNRPVAPVPLARDAIEIIADTRPTLALADAMTLARFVHPRASRETVLGNARVAYEFTRGKRRTIGFVVGAEGLSVRAPQWVAMRDVDAAVHEKADWIVRKLGETQQRHARIAAARIEWKDGASFPFLGEPVTVRLDPRHGHRGVGGAVLDAGPEGTGPRTLQLAVAQNATETQVRDAAQAWLTRQARRLFTERLDHFAPLLGVRWQKLALSNAATRWGSASSDGSIRLNWRLIHFRLPVIDYVVAHELSHLRVMDHSARFWETVESVVPDYDTLRLQLKDESVPCWS